MYIKKAQPSDYRALCQLMDVYKKMDLTKSHLNKRDIAIKACDDTGRPIGFIWGGLMANDSILYVDKFTVHPDYSKKKVGYLLCKALFEEARKRGVKTGFGVVMQDEHHDKSCFNALRFAFGGHSRSYTYITAKVEHIIKEIENLEI